MRPIALVTPWFGKELTGGAEQQAWQVAIRLAARGHQVTVLTTCCRAFQEDWSTNQLAAGVSQEQGVAIRRFPVDARDRVSFDQVNARMLRLLPSSLKPGVNPVSKEDSSLFVKENIHSAALLRYLQHHQEEYEVFIFIPYLYGPILHGLSLVADRAFLQPCLHDEVYAYLPEVERLFRIVKGLLFISEGEALLASRLYGPGILRRSAIVGGGIEVNPEDKESCVVGSRQIAPARFVLYLGRKDPTKNTALLVHAYAQFRNKHPGSALQLVLAGPGDASFAGGVAGIWDLGFVREEEKKALLARCLALFQPSRNESYSRVIMEAWFYGRPVAAHRDCLATALAVEKARGGWLAGTEAEWAELFAVLDGMAKEELDKYGANGRRYADKHATWEKVIERYEQVLGLSEEHKNPLPQRRGRLKEIHQLLPNLAYGDAISNHAIAIRDYLRHRGYVAHIFARHFDEYGASEAHVFRPGDINENAGLVYHHSIGSELTAHAVGHRGPKCLVYHNITPAEFFAPYRPEFARILRKGRAELHQLAQYFSLSVGDSAYNAAELATSGFCNPGILPIVVDPNKWNIPANAALLKYLQDGKANLLFVGRLAPNKRQEHLVKAFADYLTMDPDARLILVGEGGTEDPYYHYLMGTIVRFGLTKQVIVAGLVKDSELLAYYRTAHVFWSMSEHEGFCVPVVEAMWFDIPVLAYKSTVIPETLAEAGIMFTTKDDLARVAALAKLLVKDEALRAKVLAAQRKRRVHFLPEVVWTKLETLLDRMEP